jgi:hypothetical protein
MNMGMGYSLGEVCTNLNMKRARLGKALKELGIVPRKSGRTSVISHNEFQKVGSWLKKNPVKRSPRLQA